MVRVTVYSGIRIAKVEAYALSDEDVQFVTGINYFEGQKVVLNDNYYVTWGEHPEDVATEVVEIGAAFIFNPKDYVQKKDVGTQHLLISKQTKQLEYWITSANGKEAKLNTLESFVDIVETTHKNKLYE